MTYQPHLNRRHFVASLAAGAFALGWKLPDASPGMAAAGEAAAVGIWAVVQPDDTITVRIARSEMGQGTLTGLAQLVADEMDADWKFVRAEYITPQANLASGHAWGDMATGGSRGIRGSVDYVRKGGAVARAMLISAAAKQWRVPESECVAAKSIVTHTSTGRTLRYGELAAAAALLPVPTNVTVKDPSAWTIIGQPVHRLDTEGKLTGKQVFAIDVQLPGMLNAAIAQCPVFGGKLVSFDAAKITSMPGVRHVLKVDDATVAVVADKWFQAKTALAKLLIVWNEGENAKISSPQIAEYLRTGLDTPEAGVGNAHGDAKAALAGAARKIEAVYTTPFLSHATLEPINCTARYTADVAGNRLEIWAPTQGGDGALMAAAHAAGVEPSKVAVTKLHLGGGFGRRGENDFVMQAARIAKQVPGVPVKLIWSREEDMTHGFYRPITMAKMSAALDDHGNVMALHARISGQSITAWKNPAALAANGGVDFGQFQGWGKGEFGYEAIPNVLIDHAMRNTHIPVGYWRGVNTNQNAFYMECFIDELAHAAGADPLEFRRKLMAKNPKHLDVLNACAAKAEWGKKLPDGVYRGICQNMGFGSYTAAVAEVSVSNEGALKIHRIVAATDPGHVVNPDQVRAQVEGSFVFGLSAGLYSEHTIENGRIAEGNFDSYEVMRLAAMPKVETVIVPSGGFWGGVGEPTIAVATPAVLNAVFAATGKRIRDLPLKNQDLKRT